MRILYLCPNGYLGGAERFVLDAVWGHAHHGVMQAEILFLNDGPAVAVARELGLTADVLPFRVRLSRPWSVFKFARFLRRRLRSGRFDLLHETMPYSHILGFLASVGTRTPRVWFQHGPVGGSLDRLAMMLPASLILFNTRYLQETHNRTTVPFAWPSPQNILPCGVREHAFPASEIAALRHTLLGASKTVLAVLAGRVCPAKGQDRLITALEILRNQGRDDLLRNLRVAIVGSASGEGDLRYEQTLKDKVSSLFPDVGDSAPVIFLGHRNDVPQLFAAADCALHCTVIPEAFGLAAAEALMQNCLLIGGDVGGIRDILIDEVTGLTYPATSPNASFELAVRLTRVLEDFSAGRREHYQSLASNGRNRVRQFHGLPAMAANLESAYRALQRPGVALPTSGNQGL